MSDTRVSNPNGIMNASIEYDRNKVTAEDLVLVKNMARSAFELEEFKLLYDAQDPKLAMANLRTATLKYEVFFEDLVNLVIPDKELPDVPHANAGPWVPRLANKSDLEAITMNLAAPDVTPGLFAWEFPDRTIETLDVWHAGERHRLRTIATALLQDEYAARYLNPQKPSNGYKPPSRIDLLHSELLHTHEVRGANGFALLHPMPIFVRGERYQHVHTRNLVDNDEDIAAHDQLAKLVLYYVDDMDRSYLEKMRALGSSAYLVARGKAKERKDIGLDGLDGDEWEEVSSAEDDDHTTKPSCGSSAWDDAVNEIAQKVWLHEICHPDVHPDLTAADLVVMVNNLARVQGIPKVLGAGRVKKLVHPDLLDENKKRNIDFTDGYTIRKYNRWVVDFLAAKGVAFDTGFPAHETASLKEIMAMPLPTDINAVVPAGCEALAPVERMLVAMVRKHPEEVAAFLSGGDNADQDDRKLFADAAALTKWRGMTWVEIAAQFNALWHGSVVVNGSKHRGAWLRPERSVEELVRHADTFEHPVAVVIPRLGGTD